MSRSPQGVDLRDDLAPRALAKGFTGARSSFDTRKTRNWCSVLKAHSSGDRCHRGLAPKARPIPRCCQGEDKVVIPLLIELERRHRDSDACPSSKRRTSDAMHPLDSQRCAAIMAGELRHQFHTWFMHRHVRHISKRPLWEHHAQNLIRFPTSFKLIAKLSPSREREWNLL